MPDQSTTVAISIDSPPAIAIDGKSKLSPKMSLESEAKELLSRTGISGVGRRCAEYTPSLEELKSTSFSDYVRGEVLGVPLPGYEFLYIYEDKEGREQKREVPLGQCPPPPTSESADDADDDDDEPGGASATSGRKRRTVPSSSQHSKKSDQVEMRKTRSRTKAIEVLKRGTCTDLVPPTTAYLHQPKTYRMCWYKLRDGIAKVSLPTGFWSKMDTTGRGRHVSFSTFVHSCHLHSYSSHVLLIIYLLLLFLKCAIFKMLIGKVGKGIQVRGYGHPFPNQASYCWNWWCIRVQSLGTTPHGCGELSISSR